MHKQVLSVLAALITTQFIAAQTFEWNPLTVLPAQNPGIRYIEPRNAKFFHQNLEELKVFLLQAPAENSGHGLVVDIPKPEGGFEAFEIWKYDIMEPGLQAQFPEIGTYLGRSMETPARTIRLDHTYLGFHAQVRGLGGSWFIDPVFHLNTEFYQVYHKKDLDNNKPFLCGVNEVSTNEKEDIEPAKTISQNGTQLKTYRLAISATGEYTTFHGGTVANAQSAQVTTMNRVNGVYELDFSVRMVFIANNNLLIYTNAGTDPFTNGDPGSMITQNQSTVTSVIGSANYDIGHVFGTNSGGLAGLGVVCSNSNKARGVTGSGAPVGDPFDIDYVAHEMGHQFNAGHTFNSSTGSCNGNRSSSNAFEPGSGITIMAYAGICGADNLAPNSIDHFHARSYDVIRAFITTGNGNNCDVATNTNNSIPTVDAGPSIYSIPLSTPFRLKAVGNDANAGDQLTYCWEEYDLGNSVSLAQNPTSGTHPLFMSFSPDTSATRVFPRMQTIVNNQTDNREKLPYYARRLRFRVVVRDNRPNGGGASLDSTTIWSVANTGPFLVTQPNAFLTWTSGNSETVTWDVANTTASPISCANVNIKLSTDGGFTYPITLLANTPNDGTQAITVPNLGGTVSTCRVMVEAADNIFFDISNANFTIQTQPVQPPVAGFSVSSDAEICAGSSLNFTDQSSNTPSQWNWTFEGGNPSSSALQNPSNIQFTNPGTYNVQLTVTNSAGSNSSSQTVIVNPLPTATFNVNPANAGQANGSATAIPAGGSAPYLVQWATNPSQTGNTANNLSAGTYVVTVTDDNGCTSVFNVIVPGNAGMDENPFSLSIFPNPASEFLNLNLVYGNYKIELFDASGKLVYQSEMNGNTHTISLNTLSAGLYSLRISNDSNQSLRKIILSERK